METLRVLVNTVMNLQGGMTTLHRLKKPTKQNLTFRASLSPFRLRTKKKFPGNDTGPYSRNGSFAYVNGFPSLAEGLDVHVQMTCCKSPAEGKELWLDGSLSFLICHFFRKGRGLACPVSGLSSVQPDLCETARSSA